MSAEALVAVRRAMKACEALAKQSRLKYGNGWGRWSINLLDIYCSIKCTRGIERVYWYGEYGYKLSKKEIEQEFVKSTEDTILDGDVYENSSRIGWLESEAKRLEEIVASGIE